MHNSWCMVVKSAVKNFEPMRSFPFQLRGMLPRQKSAVLTVFI